MSASNLRIFLRAFRPGTALLAAALLVGGFQVGPGAGATATAQESEFSPYGPFPFFPGGSMFGPGFGPGGFGPGGFGPGEANWERSPDSASSSGASAASRPATMTGGKKNRPNVTVALPDAFRPGDRDGDGQIGLYEWKAWRGRAALAEFRAYDRNDDGFVTPREIAAGPRSTAATPNSAGGATGSTTTAGSTTTTSPASAAAGTPTATTPTATTPTATSPTATTPGGATSPSATTPSTPSASGKVLPTGEAADAAKRYFPLLDADKDGKISPAEWQKSVRIRGMFQDAKIDISQPMAYDDFVIHYVAASANKK